jgi:hypothetical protein
MADAFDVVGRRKLADNLYEAAFEISVRNHKDEAVTVNVIEPMLSDWEILSTFMLTESGRSHGSVRFSRGEKR